MKKTKLAALVLAGCIAAMPLAGCGREAAEEAPEGAMEVGEDDLRLLGTDDWEWIFEMSNRIRQEQEKKYHAQLIEQQKAFFSRFEELLKEQAKEIANAARDE